ncbi:MAG: hypothetical protein PF447_07115 [Spirochaetaceae bacterium]|jgi:transglutaminase-like putative cysteine protease|nr:hypothetical protein [Spirochaetaceae bacterium]
MAIERRERIIRTIIILLFSFTALSILLKVFLWGYSFNSIIPKISYTLSTKMSFTGNGDDLVVRTFLPKNRGSQEITNMTMVSEGLNYNGISDFNYTRGNWTQYNADGEYYIHIRYQVNIQPTHYEISPELTMEEQIPDNLLEYLEETENIQVHSEEIGQLARELAGQEDHLIIVLQNLYDYVYNLGSKPFKGTTDALTALRLQEASCNGKSRLFVALARNLGIPTRLVGGIILNTGTKKTTHQWAEVYMGNHWVPFDTLNGHFARLPDNYLTFYVGDEALFSHSPNIGFNYHFDISRNTITNPEISRVFRDNPNGWFGIIQGLIKGGLSLRLLQFLLVIPFAVLIVVIFKNVVGFKTYGTFLPALMAMAIQATGLYAGIIAFTLVLIVTVLLRFPLEKLGILHTPKLAIMMLGVITSLIIISALSIIFEWEGFSALNSAAVFPIAILTITSERIAITMMEEGVKESSLILFQTLIVMSLCFLIIRSVALQALVLVFPELLLGVLAMNLWLGHWTGLRIMEFYRFRSLIFRGNTDEVQN